MIRKLLNLVINIVKHKEVIETAKEIWYMVDENFRISEKVEEKLKSKAEEFDKALREKYPELNAKEIEEIRQAIAGKINAGKDPVVSNSKVIEQLKLRNEELAKENADLKEQLSKVQALIKPLESNINEQ